MTGISHSGWTSRLTLLRVESDGPGTIGRADDDEGFPPPRPGPPHVAAVRAGPRPTELPDAINTIWSRRLTGPDRALYVGATSFRAEWKFIVAEHHRPVPRTERPVDVLARVVVPSECPRPYHQ